MTEAERVAEWKRKNPEKHREQKRRYREKHREEIRAARKKYYKEHRKEILAKANAKRMADKLITDH